MVEKRVGRVRCMIDYLGRRRLRIQAGVLAVLLW